MEMNKLNTDVTPTQQVSRTAEQHGIKDSQNESVRRRTWSVNAANRAARESRQDKSSNSTNRTHIISRSSSVATNINQQKTTAMKNKQETAKTLGSVSKNTFRI
jgi:hypothetical protein